MTEHDNIARVWDIIETTCVCMLTTHSAGGLRARPVEPRPERAAGLIWFVTDLRSGKEHEIETEHDVCLVFIDAEAKAYLSITARAEVRRDHAKAAEIWKKTDNIWWSGPDDPNVCVLRVTPITAELWDGPASKAVAAYELAKARLTGEKPNLGENRKVTLSMSPPMPSEIYRLVWDAVRRHRQLTFSYHGRQREACPTVLGYSKGGSEMLVAYQVAGETSGDAQLPAWRSFKLDEVSDIRSRSGDWHGGTSHKSPQAAVQFVDVDANIPETLARDEPLPFGSPELQPPRRS